MLGCHDRRWGYNLSSFSTLLAGPPLSHWYFALPNIFCLDGRRFSMPHMLLLFLLLKIYKIRIHTQNQSSKNHGKIFKILENWNKNIVKFRKFWKNPLKSFKFFLLRVKFWYYFFKLSLMIIVIIGLKNKLTGWKVDNQLKLTDEVG